MLVSSVPRTCHASDSAGSPAGVAHHSNRGNIYGRGSTINHTRVRQDPDRELEERAPIGRLQGAGGYGAARQALEEVHDYAPINAPHEIVELERDSPVVQGARNVAQASLLNKVATDFWQLVARCFTNHSQLGQEYELDPLANSSRPRHIDTSDRVNSFLDAIKPFMSAGALDLKNAVSDGTGWIDFASMCSSSMIQLGAWFFATNDRFVDKVSDILGGWTKIETIALTMIAGGSVGVLTSSILKSRAIADIRTEKSRAILLRIQDRVARDRWLREYNESIQILNKSSCILSYDDYKHTQCALNYSHCKDLAMFIGMGAGVLARRGSYKLRDWSLIEAVISVAVLVKIGQLVHALIYEIPELSHLYKISLRDDPSQTTQINDARKKLLDRLNGLYFAISRLAMETV